MELVSALMDSSILRDSVSPARPIPSGMGNTVTAMVDVIRLNGVWVSLTLPSPMEVAVVKRDTLWSMEFAVLLNDLH